MVCTFPVAREPRRMREDRGVDNNSGYCSAANQQRQTDRRGYNRPNSTLIHDLPLLVQPG